MAKMGETLTGSISFLLSVKCEKKVVMVPLSLSLFQEIFFFILPCYIHSPCQTSSQPMSGRLYNLLTLLATYVTINDIIYSNTCI